MDRRPDVELILRALEDRGAFAVFYRRHVDGVLAFLVRRSDTETGADLTAETFATALVHASAYDPSRGEPVAWLYGIARNHLATFHRSGVIERRARRRLHMERIDLSQEDFDRIDRLASLDVSAYVIREALDDLPPHQREAVVARVVEEHSYTRISRDAAVSEVVARQRVSRGLASLRNRFGGEP